MSNKAFTLVEVLVVVVIIGILATIAIPQYNKVIERSRSAEALNNLGALRSSMERHWYEGVGAGSYVDAELTLGAVGSLVLDVDNPNEDANKMWNYRIIDNNTVAAKDYEIGAQRIGKNEYWVKLDENGTLTKSNALGGTGGGAGAF